jgi:amidophosphoribosyltransferase
MPTPGELIANGRSDDEIRRAIGADALVYQNIESMKRSVTDVNPRLTRFEASCFDGQYITGDITPEYLDRIEAARVAAPRGTEDEIAKAQMNLQFTVAGD